MKHFIFLLVSLSLCHCGVENRNAQVEAQVAIESFIDSLEAKAIEKAKFEKDSIALVLKADSIRQATVADSLLKVQRYKQRMWLLKKKQEKLSQSPDQIQSE